MELTHLEQAKSFTWEWFIGWAWSDVWIPAWRKSAPAFFHLQSCWYLMEHGGLLVTICPMGYFQSCCTIPVADWAWKQQFFFLSSFLLFQIYRCSFLELMFKAGTTNCTMSPSGVWPWTICEIKWAHLFIWMRKLFFFILILFMLMVWVCQELCQEPCKWRFTIQLQSLSSAFFFTAFVRLRWQTHTPVYLSSGVSCISLKKQVLWLYAGAFNRTLSIMRVLSMQQSAEPLLLTWLLVQQKHSY